MNWYKRYVYANITAYTLDELLYKFQMFGVEKVRSGKGDHAIFMNTNNGLKAPVPMGPGSRIVNPATMKEMLRQLDIPWGIWKALPKSPKKKEIEQIESQLPWIAKKEVPAPVQEVPAWQKSKWYQQQQQNKSTPPPETGV